MNIIVKLLKVCIDRNLGIASLRTVMTIDDEMAYYYRKYEPSFKKQLDCLLECHDSAFRAELKYFIRYLDDYITDELTDEDKDYTP